LAALAAPASASRKSTTATASLGDNNDIANHRTSPRSDPAVCAFLRD